MGKKLCHGYVHALFDNRIGTARTVTDDLGKVMGRSLTFREILTLREYLSLMLQVEIFSLLRVGAAVW